MLRFQVTVSISRVGTKSGACHAAKIVTRKVKRHAVGKLGCMVNA